MGRCSWYTCAKLDKNTELVAAVKSADLGCAYGFPFHLTERQKLTLFKLFCVFHYHNGPVFTLEEVLKKFTSTSFILRSHTTVSGVGDNRRCTSPQIVPYKIRLCHHLCASYHSCFISNKLFGVL